ncbi:hypothetical protein PR003_g31884 [Phytophthora rubi]|nr:hypothetical protein PR002_g30599 [Phytophthora rubi]KAE9267130.1 hypothetical protein PR003_g31884 [Phytophthora rubi]
MMKAQEDILSHVEKDGVVAMVFSLTKCVEELSQKVDGFSSQVVTDIIDQAGKIKQTIKKKKREAKLASPSPKRPHEQDSTKIAKRVRVESPASSDADAETKPPAPPAAKTTATKAVVTAAAKAAAMTAVKAAVTKAAMQEAPKSPAPPAVPAVPKSPAPKLTAPFAAPPAAPKPPAPKLTAPFAAPPAAPKSPAPSAATAAPKPPAPPAAEATTQDEDGSALEDDHETKRSNPGPSLKAAYKEIKLKKDDFEKADREYKAAKEKLAMNKKALQQANDGEKKSQQARVEANETLVETAYKTWWGEIHLYTIARMAKAADDALGAAREAVKKRERCARALKREEKNPSKSAASLAAAQAEFEAAKVEEEDALELKEVLVNLCSP